MCLLSLNGVGDARMGMVEEQIKGISEEKTEEDAMGEFLLQSSMAERVTQVGIKASCGRIKRCVVILCGMLRENHKGYEGLVFDTINDALWFIQARTGAGRSGLHEAISKTLNTWSKHSKDFLKLFLENHGGRRLSDLIYTSTKPTPASFNIDTMLYVCSLQQSRDVTSEILTFCQNDGILRILRASMLAAITNALTPLSIECVISILNRLKSSREESVETFLTSITPADLSFITSIIASSIPGVSLHGITLYQHLVGLYEDPKISIGMRRYTGVRRRSLVLTGMQPKSFMCRLILGNAEVFHELIKVLCSDWVARDKVTAERVIKTISGMVLHEEHGDLFAERKVLFGVAGLVKILWCSGFRTADVLSSLVLILDRSLRWSSQKELFFSAGLHHILLEGCNPPLHTSDAAAGASRLLRQLCYSSKIHKKQILTTPCISVLWSILGSPDWGSPSAVVETVRLIDFILTPGTLDEEQNLYFESKATQSMFCTSVVKVLINMPSFARPQYEIHNVEDTISNDDRDPFDVKMLCSSPRSKAGSFRKVDTVLGCLSILRSLCDVDVECMKIVRENLPYEKLEQIGHDNEFVSRSLDEVLRQVGLDRVRPTALAPPTMLWVRSASCIQRSFLKYILRKRVSYGEGLEAIVLMLQTTWREKRTALRRKQARQNLLGFPEEEELHRAKTEALAEKEFRIIKSISKEVIGMFDGTTAEREKFQRSNFKLRKRIEESEQQHRQRLFPHSFFCTESIARVRIVGSWRTLFTIFTATLAMFKTQSHSRAAITRLNSMNRETFTTSFLSGLEQIEAGYTRRWWYIRQEEASRCNIFQRYVLSIPEIVNWQETLSIMSKECTRRSALSQSYVLDTEKAASEHYSTGLTLIEELECNARHLAESEQVQFSHTVRYQKGVGKLLITEALTRHITQREEVALRENLTAAARLKGSAMVLGYLEACSRYRIRASWSAAVKRWKQTWALEATVLLEGFDRKAVKTGWRRELKTTVFTVFVHSINNLTRREARLRKAVENNWAGFYCETQCEVRFLSLRNNETSSRLAATRLWRLALLSIATPYMSVVINYKTKVLFEKEVVGRASLLITEQDRWAVTSCTALAKLERGVRGVLFDIQFTGKYLLCKSFKQFIKKMVLRQADQAPVAPRKARRSPLVRRIEC
eukprot:TRINITY_DN14773_c0_g2_i1.p1 TRINITY_DN14773_c0_g2~~TRINITY_DN14773_c0_g2_i1.p1  ORF type:complete len:1181 (+),score=182.47 TRINITY_DN14773_c0_g2_i1:57-3545(+)